MCRLLFLWNIKTPKNVIESFLIQSNQIDTEDGLKKQHLDGFGFGWLDKKKQMATL
jgi:predicted glutamine amidotransferase